MKQTAVEWLLNAIETKNGKEFSSYYSEFVEQAKEMEKQQIKQSYTDGKYQSGYYENSEQYYNETFR
jgi:HEPN domain-containing protein